MSELSYTLRVKKAREAVLNPQITNKDSIVSLTRAVKESLIGDISPGCEDDWTLSQSICESFTKDKIMDLESFLVDDLITYEELAIAVRAEIEIFQDSPDRDPYLLYIGTAFLKPFIGRIKKKK